MPCDPTLLRSARLLPARRRRARGARRAGGAAAVQSPAAHLQTGDPGGKAYVVLRGKVHVVVMDEDNQEVVIDSPANGEMFGLASMCPRRRIRPGHGHRGTSAIEIERSDIAALVTESRWPDSTCCRWSAPFPRRPGPRPQARCPEPERGDRGEIDVRRPHRRWVARFGGSWTFIISLGPCWSSWTAVNVGSPRWPWIPIRSSC